jgi:beta-phosphoglucomutase
LRFPFAFLFDLDGVIVDSNPVHVRAWEQYLAGHGVVFDGERRMTMYGMHNQALVRELFGPELTQAEIVEHGAAKEALYRELMGGDLEAHLVPGLRQFLERYREAPKAVASNAERHNVDFVVREAGLSVFFQATLDGNQVERPKPFPDVYLMAAAKLGYEPANCIVFEDSHSGVAAGIAAGMTVVGIQTTYENFDGVALAVKDFADPRLEEWLEATLHAQRLSN